MKFDNLPLWANWMAQDEDGVWWAYEVEPLQHHKGWYENEVGRSIKLGLSDIPRDWKNTLKKV